MLFQPLTSCSIFVDDARYESAFHNISRLLVPGGLFCFSELFLHRNTERGTHVVFRKLSHIEKLLAKSGFEIFIRRPVFVRVKAARHRECRHHAFVETPDAASTHERNAGMALGSRAKPDRSASHQVCKREPNHRGHAMQENPVEP
jgi:hypothetical protein